MSATLDDLSLEGAESEIRYRCARCKRIAVDPWIRGYAIVANDAPVAGGGSHDFCRDCLDAEELESEEASAPAEEERT